MKKRINIISIVLVLFAVVVLSSCEDMLDTDSNRIMLEEDNDLDSPNDTVYSILGILSKVQKLHDRYVILGELRADLMDVTEYSSKDLREISKLKNISSDNSYLDVRDYYDIINNCNYFIKNVNLDLTSQGKPLMLKEYAVAKTVRAWTYMQLALNFNEVPFFTEPLTTIESTLKDYDKKGIKEIADTLIGDLEECVGYGIPVYGNIETGSGEISGKYLFFPTRWVLADLYMWRAKDVTDYENAAVQYATLIGENKYMVSSTEENTDRRVRWTSRTFDSYSNSWSSSFTSTSELITFLPLAIDPSMGNTGNLFNLATGYNINTGYYNMETKQLDASDRLFEIWGDQIYAFVPSGSSTVTYKDGDLREKGTVYKSPFSSISYIYKYERYGSPIYRVGALYLRYAEAINRAGKPGLAFAVLKYGINSATLGDSKKVPARELQTLPNAYSMFFESDDKGNNIYKTNIGIHSRGSGESASNIRYILPSGLVTLTDSINSVEDFICTELALETALEGNRFHDLMRISNSRNDNSYLAKIVAMKHKNNEMAMYEYLLDKEKWFLPLPEYKKPK